MILRACGPNALPSRGAGLCDVTEGGTRVLPPTVACRWSHTSEGLVGGSWVKALHWAEEITNQQTKSLAGLDF